MYQIILASGSPRRKEILEQVGVTFTIKVSDKEEVMNSDNPDSLVKELSAMKARDVAERVSSPAIIIGADTVVAQNNIIFGKPRDKKHAKEMLSIMQNNSHKVYTGVCILIIEEDKTVRELSFAVASSVKVAPMNESQIEAYIETNEPMDKAGAYAIQGKFAPYILGIEGDYYNIVGLPISSIYAELYKNGIDLITGKNI